MRESSPGQNLADLLRIVALDSREIDRQDIDRSVERDAKQEVRQNTEAEVAATQKAQVQQRLFADQFDRDEQRQPNRGDHREADDEGRTEPVVLVAFFQHGLQRG